MSELTPVTRKEQFYDRILQAAESGGGGGGSTLIEKSISANGVYNASEDSADGYSKVTVDVANSYTLADEGKVVSNGALVAQTARAEITENGTYDITTNNSVSVNVSGGGVEFSNTPETFTLKANIQNLDVVVPYGVTSMGSYSFQDCTGLKSIVLPESVITLSRGCLERCTGLTSIKFTSLTPPSSINSTAFGSLPTTCKIYVPTGTLSAYTSTANMPDANIYTYVEY